MKTSELLKVLKKNGIAFKRHGGSHDIYINPKTRQQIYFRVTQRKCHPEP